MSVRPLLSCLVLLAFAPSVLAQGPAGPPPGAPLPGLTPAQLAAFQDGRDAFVQVFTPADGLGPVFNDNACAACHGGPAPGGASGRLVTRFGRARGRSFDPLTELGGSLIQNRGIAATPPGCDPFVPEVVPQQANVVTPRLTQALFGLGLVDAVPDATFEALAAAQASASRRTAGRVARVAEIATGTVRVGKFGWKSQVATLLDFSGDALLNEQGVTNPLFPDESCPQGDCFALACNPRPDMNAGADLVERLTAFQTLLAPIAPLPPTPQSLAGEAIFRSLDCASCHVEQLTTGPSSVAALDGVTFRPYSDFLLHDMGKLGDGIAQGDASGSEMRTAPLWGLRLRPRFLHDGSAQTVEAAIAAHDGQAATSRRAFQRLSATDRSDLLAFLLRL